MTIEANILDTVNTKLRVLQTESAIPKVDIVGNEANSRKLFSGMVPIGIVTPKPAEHVVYADLPFSSEHRAWFQELRAAGELHAANSPGDDRAWGPWLLLCDLGDSDSAYRLKARFRTAVKKAAIAGGGPYRVNRLDWWISKLACGEPLPSIQGLIERSVEFCEKLETNGIELGRAARKPGAEGGLYRDRYPCEWGQALRALRWATPLLFESQDRVRLLDRAHLGWIQVLPQFPCKT